MGTPFLERVTIDESGGGGSDGSGLSVTRGGRVGRIDARVGPIRFKEEFSDPEIDIQHERDTVDHEIVTGHSVYRDQGTEFVVQALGRRPPEIEITGWLTEEQLSDADALVSEDIIPLSTARFMGTAVPERVDISYSRVWHHDHGWLFETTISLLGVSNRPSELLSFTPGPPGGSDGMPDLPGL